MIRRPPRSTRSDALLPYTTLFRSVVLFLHRQPVALAAADDVGADDPVRVAQRLGQFVEVAAVARQAVHADEHARIARIAPFGVRDKMEPGRSEISEERSVGNECVRTCTCWWTPHH